MGSMLGILLLVFGFSLGGPADEVLVKLSELEVKWTKKKEEIIRNPSPNWREELKKADEVLRYIKDLRAFLEDYKKKRPLKVPEIPEKGSVGKALRVLLGAERLSAASLHVGDVTVLSFRGGIGAVYVVGRVKEDTFVPVWGVLVKHGNYIPLDEGEKGCILSDRAVFTFKCPVGLKIEDTAVEGIEDGKLVGKARVKVLKEEGIRRGKVLFSVGKGSLPVYLNAGGVRFPVYTKPEILIGAVR